MNIDYIPGKKISEHHVERLLRACLFDEGFGADNTGLKRKYNDFIEGEGNPFSHLWVVNAEGVECAVSAITGHPAINVYVLPAYRRRGIGSELIRLAQQTQPKAGGVYTPTSENLYRAFGLNDLRESI